MLALKRRGMFRVYQSVEDRVLRNVTKVYRCSVEDRRIAIEETSVSVVE